MAKDQLLELYDDEGNRDRYAGVPRDVPTRFFHEDLPRVKRVAKEMVKRAVRKATYRVRIEDAVICPWLGNTMPTFGLEYVRHLRCRDPESL